MGFWKSKLGIGAALLCLAAAAALIWFLAREYSAASEPEGTLVRLETRICQDGEAA